MSGKAAVAGGSARRGPQPDPQSLPDYCARPACRREFVRVVGPGRRQAFCSEICRRAAEKELRQARARLAHFEEISAQLRVDIAAFGRGSLGELDPTAAEASHDDERLVAVKAVHRAAGALTFLADAETPLAREFKALHEAVAPVVLACD